jgi:hypothetical protein
MKVKSIGRVLAAGFAAAVALGVTASPAAADPNPTTDFRLLAAAGSDTTQDVMNGMGEVVCVNGTVVVQCGTPGSSKAIASWDARGSATIKSKATGCSYNRPDGSGNGRLALRASEGEDIGQGGPGFWGGVNVTGCVDVARSSAYGGPNPPTTTGNYTYIPFGVDAVALAINRNGDLPVDWSFAQVQRVYRCFDTTVAGVGVTPRLIQAGSGSWTFWIGKMGITETELSLGDYPCLAQNGVPNLPRVQEHDGTILNGNLSQVVPISAGQTIAQTNSAAILAATGVTVTDRRGEARLTGMRLTGGTLEQPIKADGTLNTNFGLRRDVYNVVPTADLAQPLIDAVFTGADSAVCTASVMVGGTPRGVIETFGFGKRTTGTGLLEAACGATDLKANA